MLDGTARWAIRISFHRFYQRGYEAVPSERDYR
jgi:hypothetical protein